MPASIPTRPAAGAVIDTAWGQDVHDRVYTPKGITAAGTALLLPANTHTILNLSSRNTGNAAWLQPDNQSLKCPIGQSGYYQFEAFVSASSVGVGIGMQLRINRNGGVLVGNSTGAMGTIVTYLGASGIFSLADGDLLTLTGWCAAANASWSVQRFTVWRIADVHAAS
jgi:hypothetical protein